MNLQRRLLWAVPSLVALFASFVLAVPAVAGAKALTIQAGAVHPTNRNAPYEFTRYYPDVLKVHRGQTVRWNMPGNHTVTFASKRSSMYRPDEAPGTYALNERVAFEAASCGRDGLRPCVFKRGMRFASSGLAGLRGYQPYELTFDAPLGRYKYFCTIHPTMAGTIEVVGSRTSVPTQKQINAQIASEIRKDAKAADALFRANQTPVSSIGADGRRAWRVLLGDSTPDNHVLIEAFMPGDLQVAAGDTVAYSFREQSVNGVHSVTFPSALAGGTQPAPNGLGGFKFIFACDFDDRAGGMKGVPGLWGVAAWPKCPANAEVLVAPWTTDAHPAPGNEVLTPATYHDSGFLVAKRSSRGMRVFPDTGRVLPSNFRAEFPLAGDFALTCNMHPDVMTGSVTVT